jgi:hypothetical protein
MEVKRLKISHVLVLLAVFSLGLFLIFQWIDANKTEKPKLVPMPHRPVSHSKPAKNAGIPRYEYAKTTYYLKTGHRTSIGKKPTLRTVASNSREKFPYDASVVAVEYYDAKEKKLFTIPAEEQKELTKVVEDSTGAAHVREASDSSRYWKISSRHGTKKIQQLRIDIFAGSKPSPVVKKYSGKILRWQIISEKTQAHTK